MGSAEDFKVRIRLGTDDLEIVGGVFWDWDDDNEDQLRISFNIKKPEEFY